MRTLLAFVFLTTIAASAQTLNWSGRTWKITDGHMAGVVPARPQNLSVDGDGALHMRLSHAAEGFSGSEIFTADALGFGTYQWQIEGNNIYEMDPTVVLGLFSYGPEQHIGVSAENEIDIEFSAWNHTTPKPVNADFTVYPPTGRRRPDGRSAWEDNFAIAQRPSITTARFVWTPKKIDFYIMAGAVPVHHRPTHVLKHDRFTKREDIPQVPLPVALNLWSFREPPQHDWEIVIRSFEFAPKK